MKTIYVDVYFLINFTINIISLNFASKFSKIPIKNFKLIFLSSILSIYALIIVLFEQNALSYLFVVLLMIVTCIIGCSKIRFTRRIKYTVSFLFFEICIAGFVHWFYGILNNLFPMMYYGEKIHNRALLLLSVFVLFSIGIIKILFLIFEGANTEKNAEIIIELFGRTIKCSALVDNGNMVVDPMDSSCVIFIKESALQKVFPEGFVDLDKGEIPEIYKKNIRLIPVNTVCGKKILVGLKPDRVSIFVKNKNALIKTTIAIDKEGGTYCGYEALMPSSALNKL